MPCRVWVCRSNSLWNILQYKRKNVNIINEKIKKSEEFTDFLFYIKFRDSRTWSSGTEKRRTSVQKKQEDAGGILLLLVSGKDQKFLMISTISEPMRF